MLTASLAGLAGAAATALAMGAASPAQNVSTSDRAAIEAIVRDYILTHPEILPQAMRNLEARETGKVIKANRAAIETPFGSAWQGAADADVVLVEFFDYACSYCRASVPVVNRLLAEDKTLKVVYRELPVLGQASVDAAKASLALAESRGNYGAFHDAVFAAGRPTPETIKGALRKAGATPSTRSDTAVIAELTTNMRLQEDLRISGTPAWIVGDTILHGAVGYDELKAAIAAARARN